MSRIGLTEFIESDYLTWYDNCMFEKLAGKAKRKQLD